jgi:hypothetical protein
MDVQVKRPSTTRIKKMKAAIAQVDMRGGLAARREAG